MVNMECEFYFLTFSDVQEDLDLDSELGNRDLLHSQENKSRNSATETGISIHVAAQYFTYVSHLQLLGSIVSMVKRLHYQPLAGTLF